MDLLKRALALHLLAAAEGVLSGRVEDEFGVGCDVDWFLGARLEGLVESGDLSGDFDVEVAPGRIAVRIFTILLFNKQPIE